MLPWIVAELDRPIEIRIVDDAALERDPMPISPGRPADDRGAGMARQSRAGKQAIAPATGFRPCAPGQRREHRAQFAHVQTTIGRVRKGAHHGAIRTAGEHGGDGNAAIEIVDLSNVAHTSEVRKCEAESQLPRR